MLPHLEDLQENLFVLSKTENKAGGWGAPTYYYYKDMLGVQSLLQKRCCFGAPRGTYSKTPSGLKQSSPNSVTHIGLLNSFRWKKGRYEPIHRQDQLV